MNTLTRTLALAALALAPLGAAHATSEPVTHACSVIDPVAFLRYVEAHTPTLVELKAHYGCLNVVMPGDVSTKEFRTDNSRFLATTDAHGRIVGGSFQ
jgi:hypothetical protein